MSEYSIWVLEYAHCPTQPKGAAVYGSFNEGTIEFPYAYALIKGNGHTILVDVGHNYKDYGIAFSERFGVKNWQSPATVLKEVGVRPEDVDTVLVTHAHFDHFGNVEDFPNATFYLQEREISKWIWALSLPHQFKNMQTGLAPGDVLRGAELVVEGRMVLVDGDLEDILPGIDLFAAFDTHTFGCQFVRVRQGDGSAENTWILAGDLVYNYENTEGRNKDGVYVPVGLATGSQENMIFTIDRMMNMVGRDSNRVIPVHEHELVKRFPSRVTNKGLHVVEITLANGETSKVKAISVR